MFPTTAASLDHHVVTSSISSGILLHFIADVVSGAIRIERGLFLAIAHDAGDLEVEQVATAPIQGRRVVVLPLLICSVLQFLLRLTQWQSRYGRHLSVLVLSIFINMN